MKLKNLSANLLIITASIVIISCDGQGTIERDSLLANLDKVAGSIDTTQDDDRIDYTPIDEITSFDEPENIIFSGRTGKENKSDSAASYTYAKTGNSLFTVSAENSTADQLRNALEQTLGPPAPLGSRLRELLLRRTADFTAAEILEITEILNPAGASFFVDSENPTKIYGASSIVFEHIVTSNNRDLLAGRMRGIYNVDSDATAIEFRNPTVAERAQYRLLVPDYQIPFSSSETIKVRLGSGIWNFTLANSLNGSR